MSKENKNSMAAFDEKSGLQSNARSENGFQS